MKQDIEKQKAAEAFLMDYAAGALGEAETLLIATHLAMSPLARSMVREFETIAGTMIADLPAATVSQDLLARVMGSLSDAPAARPQPRAIKPALPHPLADYLDCEDFNHVRWTPLVRGISYTEVRLHARSPVKVHLLRLDPGAQTPAHHHDAAELSLVLNGAFRDEFGHFTTGEVSVISTGKSHEQAACPSQGCICLTVGFAPGQISSLTTRILYKLLKI